MRLNDIVKGLVLGTALYAGGCGGKETAVYSCEDTSRMLNEVCCPVADFMCETVGSPQYLHSMEGCRQSVEEYGNRWLQVLHECYFDVCSEEREPIGLNIQNCKHAAYDAVR